MGPSNQSHRYKITAFVSTTNLNGSSVQGSKYSQVPIFLSLNLINNIVPGFLHILFLLPRRPHSSHIGRSSLWSPTILFPTFIFTPSFFCTPSSGILLFGFISIILNYATDRQKERFKARSNSTKESHPPPGRRPMESVSSGGERPSLFRFTSFRKWPRDDLQHPGRIQNTRRQEEEEQAADERLLGLGETSQLRLWASSCPLLEVAARFWETIFFFQLKGLLVLEVRMTPRFVPH